MIDFYNAKPEEIIEEQYFEEYKKSLETIWWELVRLNSTIYILNKLSEFPARLLLPQGKDHFLNLIFKNFIDISIIILARVFTDNSADTHTLKWFKNQIRDKYLKKELVSDFNKLLKDNKFEKDMNSLLEKIHKIRSKLVAHLVRDYALGEYNPDLKLSLIDLKNSSDAIAKLFRLTCFGHDHHLFPLEWSPNLVRSDYLNSRTDVEEILDEIAMKSHIFHLPEKSPELWKRIKNEHSEYEIKNFNKYRKKLGYKEI